MKKCSEKDFFERFSKFERLIKYYAWKLGDSDYAVDLWGFLWEIYIAQKYPLTDKYVSVCIANEYKKLLKDKLKHSQNSSENVEEIPCIEREVDLKMDLKNWFSKLTFKEREAIFLNIFCGFSNEEIALKNEISRQAQHKNLSRGLKKIKTYFSFA